MYVVTYYPAILPRARRRRVWRFWLLHWSSMVRGRSLGHGGLLGPPSRWWPKFGYDLTQYIKKHSYHTYTYIYIYIIVGWINIPDQVMGCSPGCSRVSLCYPRLWALCGDDPATFGAHPDAIHPGRNAVPLRRPAKCREPLAAAWIPRWRQHVG